MGQPLRGERAPPGRAALPNHEIRRLPELDAVSLEATVDDRLPEAVAVQMPRPLEQRALVGGVVARQVDRLVRLERRHVLRVAREVLRPVGEPQPLPRIDGASHRVVALVLGAERRDPVLGGDHRRDRQRDDLTARPVDAVAPQQRHERVLTRRRLLDEDLDVVGELWLQRLQEPLHRPRRPVGGDDDGERGPGGLAHPCCGEGTSAPGPLARPPSSSSRTSAASSITAGGTSSMLSSSSTTSPSSW